MGAKIQIKKDSIHNFGGFCFCIDHFRKTGLANIIDNTLGIRSVLATYSHSEIVKTLMSIYLTGGSRIEDAKRLSNQFSEKTQGYELFSPDTVLKMLSDQAFYIRAMMCGALRDRINAIPEEEWVSAEINYQRCWLARLPFGAFFPKRGYSLVVQRTLCDGQTDILDGQYFYRCILTNDNESDLKDIVEFYN